MPRERTNNYFGCLPRPTRLARKFCLVSNRLGEKGLAANHHGRWNHNCKSSMLYAHLVPGRSLNLHVGEGCYPPTPQTQYP